MGNRICIAVLLSVLSATVFAKSNEVVFSSDFEGNEANWNLLSGCQVKDSMARTGQNALHCAEGNASLANQRGQVLHRAFLERLTIVS